MRQPKKRAHLSAESAPVPDKHALLKRFLQDRANLLLAASAASESLEQRCAAAVGPTITMTVDELREMAEQFGRVTALLTVIHVAEARAAKERANAA